MKSPVVPILLSLIITIPSFLSAQVVARQGAPAESPIQEFKSPMILDLPLKDFQALPFKAAKEFKEVQKYYCDDLVLSQLVVAKKEDSHRGKPPGMRLEIRGFAFVRPSYDRLASFRFDVVKGEEKIATAQVLHFNAEEGRTSPFTSELRLTAEDLERLFAAGEPPVLRVTVTVVDNS
jgi:hypothetical protein